MQAVGQDRILIKEAEKQFIRNNILQAIRDQIDNKLIVDQYIRALKEICYKDYPEKMPNILG